MCRRDISPRCPGSAVRAAAAGRRDDRRPRRPRRLPRIRCPRRRRPRLPSPRAGRRASIPDSDSLWPSPSCDLSCWPDCSPPSSPSSVWSSGSASTSASARSSAASSLRAARANAFWSSCAALHLDERRVRRVAQRVAPHVQDALRRLRATPRRTSARAPATPAPRRSATGPCASCGRSLRPRIPRPAWRADWQRRRSCGASRPLPRAPAPARRRRPSPRGGPACGRRARRRRGGAGAARARPTRRAAVPSPPAGRARVGSGSRARLPERPDGPGWNATWTSGCSAIARSTPAVARLNSSARALSLLRAAHVSLALPPPRFAGGRQGRVHAVQARCSHPADPSP